MNLINSEKKVKSLTNAELEHCVQLAQVEIDNYAICVENYPPSRMEKCGKPFMARLQRTKEVFEEELRGRT